MLHQMQKPITTCQPRICGPQREWRHWSESPFGSTPWHSGLSAIKWQRRPYGLRMGRGLVKDPTCLVTEPPTDSDERRCPDPREGVPGGSL